MAFRDRVFEAMTERGNRLSDLITSDDEECYANWASNGYRWEAEDYDTPGFQILYLCKLFRSRYETASKVFAKIGLEETPGQAIVSVDCGFGAGLAAAFEALQPNDKEAPDMEFVGIDPVEGWRGIFDELNSICHDMFKRSSFQFRKGKLSDNNGSLYDLLKRKRAAVVILSHVVLDFVKDIQAVIDEMFKIETVKRVVIMERTWFEGHPTNIGIKPPHGCNVEDEKYSELKTHVVVVERIPVSSSDSSDGNSDGSGGNSGSNGSSNSEREIGDHDSDTGEHNNDVDNLAEQLGNVNFG